MAECDATADEQAETAKLLARQRSAGASYEAFLIIQRFPALIESAPTSNARTQSQFVSYVDDPSGRGTSSLIISCLLTLILCVWSALHLNIPPPGQTRWQNIWLNTRWIIAGVYAPELVVFTAWRQWSSARILDKDVHRQLEREEKLKRSDAPRHSRRYEWTLTHSFFACTGGFVFEVPQDSALEEESSSDGFLPPSCSQRLPITARGMALLVKCGHIPDISKAEIEDKSKANALAKALVIIQALWMLLQVLGRLIARLPVTLLEVNTVAHVFCAFSMYAMWWDKPLNSNEPILIHGNWIEPLCAYMYMSSQISGEVDKKQIKSQTIIKTLFAFLNLFSKTPEIETLSFQTSTSTASPATPTTDCPPKPPPLFQNVPDSCLKLVQAAQQKEAGTAFFERRPRVLNTTQKQPSPSPSTLRRHLLAAQALETHFPILASHILHSHPLTPTTTCTHFKPQQLLASHIQNWPWDDLLRNIDGLTVGMILWLANFLYGGIHAAAWNEHFPSAAEKWLWRASAAYIGFCGGLWVLLNYIVSSYPPLNEFWEKWMDGAKGWWQNLLLGGLVFVCGLTLMLARAFIVVEAFVSIRQLPKEAYDTPSWAQIFPHF